MFYSLVVENGFILPLFPNFARTLLEAVLEPLPEPLLERLFELVIERVTIALVCLFLPRVPSLTELLEVLFADMVEDLALAVVEGLTVELLVDLLMRVVLVERPWTSCSKVSSNSSGMFRISCPDCKEYFLVELVTFWTYQNVTNIIDAGNTLYTGHFRRC